MTAFSREVGGDSLLLLGLLTLGSAFPAAAVSIEVGLPFFFHRSHLLFFIAPLRFYHVMESFYFLLCNWGHLRIS